MIFEHQETGLRVVVNAVEEKIAVEYPTGFRDKNGRFLEVTGQVNFVTESGQPCIAISGDLPPVELAVHTDTGEVRLVRVS